MQDNAQIKNVPPIRIHFGKQFPIETRCKTSEDEYAVVEILKVEYGLDKNEDDYDITFFVSGIKSFSVSDDDQECFIQWNLLKYNDPDNNVICSGNVSTGAIEMGERFNDMECTAKGVKSGDYLFDILYI